ncbi:hypothetical protein KBB68_02785, partial [Candidatus Babeliales bacterium]|nr:hypothetical protein [Candidatus Babeliales bacterium]
SNQENIPLVYNIVPVVEELRLQGMISKCRLIVIPIIIVLTLYCNQKKIVQMIEKDPFPFALLAYFLGNCVIDSIAKYRQIDQTLEFFLFAQMMSRYMLCLFAIKNTMKKITFTKSCFFDEQNFLTKVIESTGYSIEELEIFSAELLGSSINSINKLCIDINTTDIEEKMYLVFKEQISLEQILLLCKNDADIYTALMKFHKNPEQEFENILKTLCVLIRGHFNYFMKNRFCYL